MMNRARHIFVLSLALILTLALIVPQTAMAGESEWGGPETKDSSVTRGQRDTETKDFGTLERGRDIARGKDTAAKPSTGVKLTGDEFGSRPDSDEADLSGPRLDYHGEYSGGITQDGVQGNASLGGDATLVSGQTGKLGWDAANANASAKVGASGQGEANVEISTQRVAAELEGNAIIGAEGKGSVTICITLCGAKLEGTVEGTVYAGAGGRGRALIHISWRKIKLGAKLAGALGLGAGLGTDITIDISSWTDAVVDWWNAPPSSTSSGLPNVPRRPTTGYPIFGENFFRDPLAPFLPQPFQENSNSDGMGTTLIDTLTPQGLQGDGWSQTPKRSGPLPYSGAPTGWRDTSKIEQTIEKLVQGKDMTFDPGTGRTSYIDRTNGHTIEIDANPFHADGVVIVIERDASGRTIARAAVDVMGQIRQLPVSGQIMAPQKAVQKEQKQKDDEEASDGFDRFDAIQSGQPLFWENALTPAASLDSTPETRSIQEDAQSPKLDSKPNSPDC